MRTRGWVYLIWVRYTLPLSGRSRNMTATTLFVTVTPDASGTQNRTITDHRITGGRSTGSYSASI